MFISYKGFLLRRVNPFLCSFFEASCMPSIVAHAFNFSNWEAGLHSLVCVVSSRPAWGYVMGPYVVCASLKPHPTI